MKILSLLSSIDLIHKLNISIKDGKYPPKLAEDLLSEFPEYGITVVGYRTIRGDWDDNFENVHWSHSLKGSEWGYLSVYSSLKNSATYTATIKGFDVHKFWNDISKNQHLKTILCYSYMDEEEILAIEILSEIKPVTKENESTECD